MRIPLILAPALLFAALLPSPAPAAERVCDKSESTLYPGPGGRWTVSVQEEVCSTDKGGAAAGITVTVGPPANPLSGGRVVITAVPRSRDHGEWPRPVWHDAKTLEVFVPNMANVLEVKPAYEGIDVKLTYCKDNPEHRALVAGYQTALKDWMRDTTAWVERRKQDAASAGARPTRPVEPRVPVGRCDAADLPPAG
jgi:hypothetical protein